MKGLDQINNTEAKTSEVHNLLQSFEMDGAEITPDTFGQDAYIIQFNFSEEKCVATIRLLFDDATGSDIVITNMTVLPSEQTGKGVGSRVIKNILEKASNLNLKEIRATQVETENEKFWIKNGFTKQEEPNLCNDFIFKFEK